MFIDYFLDVAYGLAVLTYFLGVLMYSLPVPLWSVKRWGSILIQDGLFSALLILLFNFIIYLISFMRDLLGASTQDLFSFLYGIEDSLISILLFIKFTTSVLGVKGLIALSSIFSPFSGLLVFAISSVAVTIIISSLVLNNTGLFIALGMALYALPFRVGRSAGSSLIAFAVISSIALPLLPQWVEMFTSNASLPQMEVPKGIVFLSGYVKGDKGSPVTGLVLFTDKDTNRDYIFVIRKGGYYNAGKPDKGIPSNKTYKVKILFLGHKLPANIDIVAVPDDLKRTYSDPSADYRLDIKVSGVFLKDSIYLDVNGCYQYTVKQYNASHYAVTCYEKSVESPKIRLIYQQSCRPIISGSLNVSSIEVALYNYTWHGIKATEEEDTIHTTNSSFSILYGIKECQVDYPNVAETHYSASLINSFSAIIISTFWIWIAIIIAILSYLTLITLLTYGLAWALGGWRPRVPVPFI